MPCLSQPLTIRQKPSQQRQSDSFPNTTSRNRIQNQPVGSVRTTYQGSHDVNNYILHLHSACFHRFQPHFHDSSEVLQLGTELVQGDNLAAPVLLVVHPRLCPSCLSQRTTTLKANMLKRLRALLSHFSDSIEDTEENQAKLQRECAYLAGVFKGRTHAIFTPLADNESLGFMEKLGDNVDLSSVLEDLTLHQHHPALPVANGSDDQMEDILDRFETLEVTRDEIGYEVRRVMETWEEERLGFDDGRFLQASVERAGIAEFDETKRDEILSGALL